jgi:hypothetical protein
LAARARRLGKFLSILGVFLLNWENDYEKRRCNDIIYTIYVRPSFCVRFREVRDACRKVNGTYAAVAAEHG